MARGGACGAAGAAGAGVRAGCGERVVVGCGDGDRWGIAAVVAGATDARMGVCMTRTRCGGRGAGGAVQHGPHVFGSLLAGDTRRRAV